MRAIIQVVAAAVWIASLSWWWLAGANTGWTKTSVQVWQHDEITGISYPETVPRWVPGVDFLCVVSAGWLGVVIVTRFWRRGPCRCGDAMRQ